VRVSVRRVRRVQGMNWRSSTFLIWPSDRRQSSDPATWTVRPRHLESPVKKLSCV